VSDRKANVALVKNESLFALKSSRIVTPAGEIDGAVVVDQGVIREVVKGELPEDLPVVDFGDLIISPGVIDSHVHINDPGTDWEGFETATAAAAAGGITTLIDMPLNSDPVTTSVASLHVKRDAAKGNCHVDVGFYGGVVPGNSEQISLLLEQGVFGLKAFLCDSGLEAFPAVGEAELRSALEVLQGTGVPLLAHAELVSDSQEVVSDFRSYQEYMNSRPPEFETSAIALLIGLCREYQTPVHVVHLATASALSMIESAKSDCLPLTVETCPHYLLFSSKFVADGDTRFKCAPPIRDEENRTQLSKAVGEGLIDSIGSDHSPCPAELKHLDSGDFFAAWGGIAGLQLSLPVMWTVGTALGWTPSMVAKLLSENPAKIFGLSNLKGSISPGMDADFVVWDPDSSFEVDGEQLKHRHKVSPYDGVTLHGVVHCSFLRGNCVFDVSDRVNSVSRYGQLLSRGNGRQRIAERLNSLDEKMKRVALESCCAASAWVDCMMSAPDFRSDKDVFKMADDAAEELTESSWLEAFAAHPRIGDVETLKEKYANTRKMASGEQSGIDSADDTTLQRLSQANDEYFDKFGFIFIVCATGKSASEMLALLEERLGNDRATEISIAAAEQMKITKIRLGKLVSSLC
jgi:allantoinase